jgi:flagellar FliL protein
MRIWFRLIPLLLIISCASAWAADEENGEGEKASPKVTYHSLSPSLIGNIKSGGRYARCDVQLMTKDESTLEAIRLHTPALRHELLLLIGEQSGKDLTNPKGKERFRKAALKALQGVMKEMSGKESIDDLFFTAFFVQ